MQLHIRAQASDFVHRVSELSTRSAIASHLHALLNAFGLEYFIVTGLPMPGGKLDSLVMCAHWPEGWWDRYMMGSYVQHDPVAQHCYRTHRLFRWDEAPITSNIKERGPGIMREAGEFGLVCGVSLPIHTEDGFQACVSFAGARHRELDPEACSLLEMVGYATNGRLRFLGVGPLTRVGELTLREKEVIKWTAAGKTKWEIARILSISEHTVDKHVRAVIAKLRATNKTQAAVEAIRYGQITL